jgi:shikimate kinase
MTALASRSVVLVTGMSGTGKSTVLAELDRRGHQVVDTDDPGWIVEVGTPEGMEPMWDLARIGALLEGHRAGWLFVSGCVANQRALYDRLDAVVLLSAPVDVLLARVVDRANPFGSRPEERAKIARDVAEFEPQLRASADHEISTTAPVAEVVATLERLAAEAAGRADRSVSDRRG